MTDLLLMQLTSNRYTLTPVAGLIFETKNRAIFSGELFSGEEFLEQHYYPYNFVPINVSSFRTKMSVARFCGETDSRGGQVAMDSWSTWGLENFTCCTCSHEDAEDLTNRKLIGGSHPRAAYGLQHTEDLRGVSPEKLVEGRGPGRNLSTSLSGLLS